MWSLDNLSGDSGADSVEIREVWDSNLEEELSLIRSIVADYPFISVDTKFPGVALLPVISSTTSLTDFNYKTLKINVDALKLIQLGLTFFDSSGRLPLFGSPPRPCNWQFNFREFNAARDIFDPSSVELFRLSGMDYEKNHRHGVAANRFAELIISSGVLLNDTVQWITFHSCYDLGFLLKMLSGRNLPDSREGFYLSLQSYFPKVYDMKHLMKFCNNLYGGMNKLAEDLGVKRVGNCHQAGSDSLLTAALFKKLKDLYFNGSVERYAGVFLCGLGVD